MELILNIVKENNGFSLIWGQIKQIIRESFSQTICIFWTLAVGLVIATVQTMQKSLKKNKKKKTKKTRECFVLLNAALLSMLSSRPSVG